MNNYQTKIRATSTRYLEHGETFLGEDAVSGVPATVSYTLDPEHQSRVWTGEDGRARSEQGQEMRRNARRRERHINKAANTAA